MAQTVGFSRALATVRRTVAARRDAKRRTRAVQIPPCSPYIVCRKKIKSSTPQSAVFGADARTLPRPKNAPPGHFCPAGRKAPGRSCSHPPAYVSLTFAQKKTASVPLHQRFFHGRGWITQAALLKTAHGAVFALSSATAPQLFESIRPALRRFHVKQKSSVITTLDFLVERSNPNPNHCPLGHLWRRFHRK